MAILYELYTKMAVVYGIMIMWWKCSIESKLLCAFKVCVLSFESSDELSCSEHYLTLEINEFRCYEAEIEESENAGSCWESNPGHL